MKSMIRSDFKWNLTTMTNEEERVKAMALPFFGGGRWLYGKAIEALTHKGVFIGLLTKLK